MNPGRASNSRKKKRGMYTSRCGFLHSLQAKQCPHRDQLSSPPAATTKSTFAPSFLSLTSLEFGHCFVTSSYQYGHVILLVPPGTAAVARVSDRLADISPAVQELHLAAPGPFLRGQEPVAVVTQLAKLSLKFACASLEDESRQSQPLPMPSVES